MSYQNPEENAVTLLIKTLINVDYKYETVNIYSVQHFTIVEVKTYLQDFTNILRDLLKTNQSIKRLFATFKHFFFGLCIL